MIIKHIKCFSWIPVNQEMFKMLLKLLFYLCLKYLTWENNYASHLKQDSIVTLFMDSFVTIALTSMLSSFSLPVT
jgi:hypothetical protein